MAWQVPVLAAMVIVYFGSFLWVRRAAPAERNQRARDSAKILVVVGIVQLVVVLTLMF